MNDVWLKRISIVSIAICFLLSPLLFPESPDISKTLMYALFVVTGVMAGIPTISAGIRTARGK